MTVFSGVIPPVVVARKDDGSLDSISYKRNLNRLIEAGVNGLFVLGSSGEGAFVTSAERERILTDTVSEVRGRVPILVGAIDTQTQRVVEHIKASEKFDIDAIVATAPFYALGGTDQVEKHFRLLHEATTLPIFAYDIPVCVHTKLPVDLMVQLGKDGVLAGVKDSSGDDVGFRKLVIANRRAGHPLRLFTGHEVVVDGAYLAGADGSVPGLANIDPHGYVRQWRSAQSGDWEQVRDEQDRLADLMDVAMIATSISGFGAGVGGFKEALKIMGVFDSAKMPDPVAQLTEDESKQIRKILDKAGLLD